MNRSSLHRHTEVVFLCQVNKSHIKLIGKGDRKVGAKDSSRSDKSEEDVDTPKSKSGKPWEKTPFIANNFENRHNAQQTILENQQKQLKEQQRIIEELQYLQQQQLLQQQITNQQLIGKNSGADGDTTEQISKLQEHLNNLQKNLVETQVAAQGNKSKSKRYAQRPK